MIAAANDTANTDFACREIKQQCEFETGCLEIIHTLRYMGIVEDFGYLEFDDNRVFDKQVSDIFADDYTLVVDVEWLLLDDLQTTTP